jgi:DNA-binding transcriptional regulator YiaG
MENTESLHPQPETSLIDGEHKFAVCLKRIRLGLKSKQSWLATAIGCTDAAVSLWESGTRVPTTASLGRLLSALAEEGTPTAELLELRGAWLNECARRASRRG